MSKIDANNCIASIEFLCPKTKKYCSLSIKDVSFSGGSAECEICGSHGDVTMTIGKCPECKKEHIVSLYEW